MQDKDWIKVGVLLLIAAGIVGAFCYARVDLGMTLDTINQELHQWADKASTLAVLIWSQILVAGIMGVGYQAWRQQQRHQERSRQTRKC